ncbi:MAG: nuclear transport factor 2 family protein [Nocardiaceae bacterium]|nr:nuclear transport factor 2 family protein [Nocardiaceae bacterium]
MNEIDTVKSFLAALEDFDNARAYALVDDDIVYQNNHLPPARGRKAFERTMEMLGRFGDHFEARIHHIAQDGNVVLTQRTDVLGNKGANFEFWVWGAFEVRNGKIVDWHDYFDWAQFSGRMLAVIPKMAFKTLSRR